MDEPSATLRFASLPLFLAAGASLYLILLNRWLIGMKGRPFKLPPIRVSMIAIGFAAAAFGWWAAGTLWLLAPALVLSRRCRGSLPVETADFGITLHQPDTTTDLAVLRSIATRRGGIVHIQVMGWCMLSEG